MNSHQQMAKRLRSDEENIDPPATIATTSKRSSFFSEEKENEFILFAKIRTLDTNLRRQNYKLLLGARLTSIDSVTSTYSTPTFSDKRTLLHRHITSPAAKYLGQIIHDLRKVVLENSHALEEYLIESMNSNTTQNNQHVIFLADILMTFKANIDKTQLLSDKAGIFENTSSKEALKQNCNWITYFDCVINSALDKMEASEKTYHDLTLLTSTIQTLQTLTYDSLKKNFPTILDQYTALEDKKMDINAIQSFFSKPRQRNMPLQQNSNSTNAVTVSSPHIKTSGL